MSDTYNYEVLEPGGHARLVGNVLDRISEASANPASAVGSSRALLGDTETASWMERTTAADGAALIESVKGNTLRWNQLVGADTSTVTIPSGHKYHSVIGGTSAIATSDGTAISVTGGTDQLFDLTQMFGAGNEPATVAEFEALFPEPYYPYDAGSLLPVRMEGIQTTGKNLLDVPDVTTSASSFINSNGAVDSRELSTVGPLAPGAYTLSLDSSIAHGDVFVITIANQDESYRYQNSQRALTQGHNVFNIVLEQECTQFICYTGVAASLSNFQLEAGSTATAYEPHWRSERAIPVATYFPGGMRGVGDNCDELTNHEAITRVGAVDLGTLDWTYSSERFQTTIPGVANVGQTRTPVTCSDLRYVFRASGSDDYTMFQFNTAVFAYNSTFGGDEAAFKAAMSGVMLHYALATPTTTPIDPPLPLSYRVGAGGTERVMVASGTTSAPPIFVTRYPLDPADLAASIAPRESVVAEANHAVGDLIMLGFALCKVTTSIARGEAITIGTNVTKTSVAAEIAALS